MTEASKACNTESDCVAVHVPLSCGRWLTGANVRYADCGQSWSMVGDVDCTNTPSFVSADNGRLPMAEAEPVVALRCVQGTCFTEAQRFECDDDVCTGGQTCVPRMQFSGEIAVSSLAEQSNVCADVDCAYDATCSCVQLACDQFGDQCVEDVTNGVGFSSPVCTSVE